MYHKVKKSRLAGEITIPPSKSHTLRAILFASFANGQSKIYNFLPSPDTNAMVNACTLLGATIRINDLRQEIIIIGNSGKLTRPRELINAGNSGQVLRFIAAVSALTNDYVSITGDNSLKTNRPIQPLIDGLTGLGVFAKSTNGFAPVIVKGPLQGGITTLDGEDSQPVSGLLIASAFARNKTYINVLNPGEKPWVDLTLAWFTRLGINFERQGYTHYVMHGNSTIEGFEYMVPGDFSSCAFPLVAALITNSEITLCNLDLNDCQGDKALIYVLQTMGANICINSQQKKVHVKKSNYFAGKEINVNNFIDALPILTVIACFAKTETIITGAAIARKKESNRCAVIANELKKMGAQVIEHEDGLIITPSQLKGAKVISHRDHRIAMALMVAGLASEGETIVDDPKCIEKSYPNFVKNLQGIGASIEIFP